MDLRRAKLNVEFPEFALIFIWQSWDCFTDIHFDALEYLVQHSSKILLPNVKTLTREKLELLKGYKGNLIIGLNL